MKTNEIRIEYFEKCLHYVYTKKNKALRKHLKALYLLMWAHLGLNQGPPDYESGALTS